MALSVGLITGHGDGEHVTSFDARAFNRSMFGRGKYILQDAENLKVQISALTGTVQISAGSCLWSGMHIRVEEEGSFTYTTPASTDYVYVWLHYIRNPENLVESVEFVTTTGNKPELELIADEITDEMTEAYTLFCSFTHDTATNTAQSISSDFALRLPLDDTAKTQNSAQSAFQATVSQQINVMSEKVEGFAKSIPTSLLSEIGTGWVTLGAGRLNTAISLSESVENFAMFIIFAEYSGWAVSNIYTQQSLLYSKGSAFNAIHQQDGDLNIISFDMMSDINGFAGNKLKLRTNHSKKHADEGTLGGGYTQTSIPESDIYVRMMGIGRIKGA